MRLKSAEEVARDMILDHAFNIDYLTIGEYLETLIYTGELPEMTAKEFEDFQDEVDRLISNSSLEVRFE